MKNGQNLIKKAIAQYEQEVKKAFSKRKIIIILMIVFELLVIVGFLKKYWGMTELVIAVSISVLIVLFVGLLVLGLENILPSTIEISDGLDDLFLLEKKDSDNMVKKGKEPMGTYYQKSNLESISFSVVRNKKGGISADGKNVEFSFDYSGYKKEVSLGAKLRIEPGLQFTDKDKVTMESEMITINNSDEGLVHSVSKKLQDVIDFFNACYQMQTYEAPKKYWNKLRIILAMMFWGAGGAVVIINSFQNPDKAILSIPLAICSVCICIGGLILIIPEYRLYGEGR